MIKSVLCTIFGAAIIIGILRGILLGLIEEFPVTRIVIATFFAILAVAVVSYVVYRLVIIIKNKKSAKKEKIQPSFLEALKEEESKATFWEE